MRPPWISLAVITNLWQHEGKWKAPWKISDEDNGNSKWWYLNVSNFRKTTFRTDVWYTGRFTNGFTKFETSWKASLYHLEEDGDGSYSVSNLTASWNPEIARSLAVLTLSVLYFSVVWHVSLIFQLVFCPNVYISNFILGKLMGKFGEIL